MLSKRRMLSCECQLAFDLLKQKLVEASVLAYPTLDHELILETDASVQGLGAVLQKQGDFLIHSVAYASRALSQPEQNYRIMELEILALVWALSHFKTYLYRPKVKVVTNHTAVKSFLLNPAVSGKHARWWVKAFCRCLHLLSELV